MTSIVLDTNVLVSAVIAPFGPPARILSAVLNGDVQILFDDRIMLEYREVLKRKKFGIAPRLIDEVLDYINGIGRHVTASPLNIKLKDISDMPFIEVTVAGPADALVTGNIKHFPAKIAGIKVITPQNFVKEFS